MIDDVCLTSSHATDFTHVPWNDSRIEIVLDCSAKNKNPYSLNPYFEKEGLKKVIDACPVRFKLKSERENQYLEVHEQSSRG